MKKLWLYGACVAVALALPLSALAADRPARAERAHNNPENKFLMRAAEDNLAEVQLGQLAKDHASSDDVKKFADRMATDHQKAYDELQTLAPSKGATLPTEPGARAKKEYDRLSKLSGADFDREYMRVMARDHDRDVKAFERESKSAKDAEVKDWAGKTLPTLKDHQKMAHDLAGQKGTARRGSSSPSASPSTTSDYRK